MNWVDVLAFVILARAASIGFKRGLGGELIDLMAAISAAFIALHHYGRLGGWLQARVAVPAAISSLVAWVMLVAVVLGVWKLVALAAGSVARLEVVPQLNAFGGMTLGIVRGMVLLSLLLVGLELTTVGYLKVSVEERSLVGSGVRGMAPALYQAVLQILPSHQA
jgi:uncharacterized membrane protein required for colicin V production